MTLHEQSTIRDGGNGACCTESRTAAQEQAPAAPWVAALGHFGELSEHLRTLMALRVARRKLMLRRWFVLAAIVALMATALVPLVLAGVSLLVLGMTQGLQVLFDGRPWLANLVAGGLILGGLAACAKLFAARMASQSIQRMAAKHGEIPADEPAAH